MSECKSESRELTPREERSERRAERSRSQGTPPTPRKLNMDPGAQRNVPIALPEVASAAKSKAASTRRPEQLTQDDLLGGNWGSDDHLEWWEEGREEGQHSSDDDDDDDEDDVDVQSGQQPKDSQARKETEEEAEEEVADVEESAQKAAQKVNHEEAVKKCELPATVKTPRHREVWYLALDFKNANIKNPAKNKSIKFTKADELAVWNKAREALRKAKAALKKKRKRAEASGKKGKKAKDDEAPVDAEDGHPEEMDSMIGPNAGWVIQCGASANELARLVHVMADESAEDALMQLIKGFDGREVYDDKLNRPLPWTMFKDLFNDPDFVPENYFLNDANSIDRLREVNPAELASEVTDVKLRGKKHCAIAPEMMCLIIDNVLICDLLSCC